MPDYIESIRIALENTYRRFKRKPLEIDISNIRWIIFSDQHRGQGDGADDFLKCKPFYHAALGYYLSAGYTLFLLGDAEELWESYPSQVIRMHADSLELERRFIEADPARYHRIFGNHDDLWSWRDRQGKQNLVQKYLAPYILRDNVDEGILFRISCRNGEVRELLMTHGHQGDFINDQISWLSRLVVRYIWRNIQRIFRIRSNTAAAHFELRGRQEKALYEWVVKKDGLMLICGDTHHPVFASKVHVEGILEDLEMLKKEWKRVRSISDKKDLQEIIDLECAELELARAKTEKRSKDWGLEGPGFKPCYFNSGACCFKDGDITGIEISEGKIRLVRWPDDNGHPRRKVLREADFEETLLCC